MKKISLESWVRKHRNEIDEEARAIGCRGRMNDEERGDMVANVESLYLWAVEDGVDFS
jgi:hypothetical protein